MTRNRNLYLLFIVAAVAALFARHASAQQSKGQRYNVLFIAVDDLNDWVGCLGGNPQAITPNFDRFAREHAMIMNKAYCPSTVCGPTRSALLTGKHATYTGVYGNGQNLKHAPKAKTSKPCQNILATAVTIPSAAGRFSISTATLLRPAV